MQRYVAYFTYKYAGCLIKFPDVINRENGYLFNNEF